MSREPAAPRPLLLVVEDDDGLRKLIDRHLQRCGYETVGVGSGRAALEWLAGQSAELMLLDYTLPDMSGEQVVEVLAERGAKLPFIVVTGHGNEMVAAGMMKRGARDYLVKNASFLELLPSVVTQVLAEVERERQLTGAQQALVESERRYAVLTQISPVGIFRTDATGRVVYANSRWRELTRGNARTDGSMLWYDMAPPLERERIEECWSRLRSDPEGFYDEFPLASSGPHPRWVIGQIVAETSEHDEVLGFVGTLTDITAQKEAELALRSARDELELRVEERTATLLQSNRQLEQQVAERRRAEQALRISESRFRLLAENAQDVIFRYRLRPRPFQEYISPAIEKTSGFSHDMFYDDPYMAVRIVHPRDRARLFDLLYDPSRLQASIELRWVRRDGNIVWVELRSVPIIGNDGRVTAIEGICRDVTERKKAEEALQSEQRLLKKLLDLQEADRRLVAYEIHDGLVQHATAAKMHLETATRLAPFGPGRSRDEYETGITLLRSTIDEARRLISGLRPLILDESGIVIAIEYLANELKQQHQIETEYVCQVAGDALPRTLEDSIFRICQEAITNIGRHSQSPRARIEFVAEGDEVRLTVRDWGIGFCPQEVGPGHFGLRGVKERVRLLGGTLSIESSPGQGTTIECRLPLLTPSLAAV